MYPARPFHYPQLAGWLLHDGVAPNAADVRVYRTGDWSVVEICGELDLVSAPSVPPLLATAGPLVVFDLTRVTFMDCRGLGLLARAAGSASERGGCIRVAGASRQVRRLVTLGLPNTSLPMFDSLEEALRAPAPPDRKSATHSPRR